MSGVAASTSIIGSRRRAAAIASPSRVCAFSRFRRSAICSCQVARSTIGGKAGRMSSIVIASLLERCSCVTSGVMLKSRLGWGEIDSWGETFQVDVRFGG
jgi:hypothetical protein